MAPVVIENLVKLYPDKSGSAIRAVNQINLTIADGEFMVLVGPSGCGKSTTLRMIAGLEEISGGTISIDGRIINDVLPKDRDIAMVFQNYALYPHMSVYENLAFGLKLRKVPTAQIEERVRSAASLLGLADYLDRKPKTLSGGQRQRVAVGRAIVRQPKVFLFDEPLSNLDAKMRVSMRAEIVKLHARLGATMIYVTHDQVEAMTMGNRICVMRDGNIMQVATPLELYNRPANLFVAGFIGSPPMNLLHGTLRSAGNSLQFVEAGNSSNPAVLTLDPTLSEKGATFIGRPMVLGIRPENLHEVGSQRNPSLEAVIEAKLEMSEPMGAETYLHLHTGTHSLIARVAPTNRIEAGQLMRLALDLNKAHLFDAASEQVLT